MIKWRPNFESSSPPGSYFDVEYKKHSDINDNGTHIGLRNYSRTNDLKVEHIIPNLDIGSTYEIVVVACDEVAKCTPSEIKNVTISHRPTKPRFETADNEEISFENEYSSKIETKCSLPCGPGVKTEITMTCLRGCFPDCCQRIVKELPCEIAKCRNAYGPWSEWSECSKSCISNIGDRSIKSRIRNCLECEDVAGTNFWLLFQTLWFNISYFLSL